MGNVMLRMARGVRTGEGMSTVEYVVSATPQGGLRTWVAGHGLAVALFGCALFWAAVGLGIYFAI
jgi:hypothetical protein